MHKRLHSALGHQSPLEFEKHHSLSKRLSSDEPDDPSWVSRCLSMKLCRRLLGRKNKMFEE